MRLAKFTTAAALSWLLTPFCAAQPFQVIGNQPGVGPICIGPLGSSPCADVQNYIAMNQLGFSTTTIGLIGNNLRQSAASDPRTANLGWPGLIRFSMPLTSQGLTLLTARVIHQRGWSEWRLGLLSDGRLAIQDLIKVFAQAEQSGNISAQSSRNGEIGAIIRNPRVIWGSPPSTFNNPGQLSGGPNSNFNNPGQILGRSNSAFNYPGQFSPNPSPLPSNIPNNSLITTPVPPPQIDSRVVEFLIATTRKAKPATSSNAVHYSGERAELSFGAASVRIPEDHKIGHIELPGSWSLFGLSLASEPNDKEHFVIKQISSLSEETFGQIVKNTNAKSALIFVHGFNTSFDDSVLRNAQIVWDLQFHGLSVLFSWASRGEATDYVYDKESAYLARGSFIRLVEMLRREYGVEQINVLAHSMGNLITLDALAGYAQTRNPVSIARFIMAAPDVDRDQFIDLAPKAKVIVGGITLYASSADRALALSRRLAGNVPRAGDVPLAGPIEMPGVVDTIDVTAVGDDVLGLNHNVFAASRDVMEDISAMLRNNQPPPRLIQIRGVPEPPNAAKYWRYVK